MKYIYVFINVYNKYLTDILFLNAILNAYSYLLSNHAFKHFAVIKQFILHKIYFPLTFPCNAR